MMPQRIFRLPQELLDAAERRAAETNLSFSDYVRKLIEDDTGIKIEVKMGLAGTDAKTRKRVQSIGVKAFQKASKARAKEKSHAK